MFTQEKYLSQQIDWPEPSGFAEKQSLEWFKKYIVEASDRRKVILHFATGWIMISLGGLSRKIQVTFLPDDDELELPTSSACLFILHMPTVHSNEKLFAKFMDIALKFGSMGFPNP